MMETMKAVLGVPALIGAALAAVAIWSMLTGRERKRPP